MADHALITRRAAFVGAAVSTAALAVPAIAAVHRADPTTDMEPIARAKYYARQAALAMNEINPGKWQVTVSSKDTFVLIHLQHEWTWVPTEIPGLSTPTY